MAMKVLIPLAAAALLSACAEGWVSWQEVSDIYSVGKVNAAVRDGALPAAVFGAPGAALDEATILAALHPPGTVVADRFAADPGAVTRVVLIFDPSPELAGTALCDSARARAVARSSTGDTLIVQTALCVGRKDIASARAVGPPAAWTSFVQQSLLAILPAEHRVNRGAPDVPVP